MRRGILHLQIKHTPPRFENFRTGSLRKSFIHSAFYGHLINILSAFINNLSLYLSIFILFIDNLSGISNNFILVKVFRCKYKYIFLKNNIVFEKTNKNKHILFFGND